MLIRNPYLALALLLLTSCYQPQRDCTAFKDGAFSFTSIIEGDSVTSTFVRVGTREIDYFEGKSDTASVRWINDCEYVLKKLQPQNRDEDQDIHMKILSTTDTSYTFEYGILGTSRKLRGIATRVPEGAAAMENTD
jgi:hypothetical protein